MPINTIEYVTLMQKALDQHIVEQSTSGWMEANEDEIQYNGGKYIKLPRITTTGLGDYDRDLGFNKQGSVTLAWDQYEMTQDRATTFQLDSMDVNETNFVMNASSVIKTFQSEQVIPEIDAYRYSALNAIAKKATNTEEIALTADNALSKFREHVRAVRDYFGQDGLLICSITSNALALIEDSPKVTKSLNVTEFKQGNMDFRVKTIDDVIFRIVPSVRMKTAYVFNDGTTEFGFKPDAAATNINWIISPSKTPLAVSRTDKLRVFEPDTNQKADAWKIDYRKYHDLWVKKSREKTVFTCTSPAV